jgi:hypothetical protein
MSTLETFMLSEQYFSMAVYMRAVPFWGLCVNWLIGLRMRLSSLLEHWLRGILVFFGNLVGSLFSAAILVRCGYKIFVMAVISYSPIDTGIVSVAPYHDFIATFAMYVYYFLVLDHRQDKRAFIETLSRTQSQSSRPAMAPDFPARHCV